MVEFVYNNAKHATTWYTFFELKRGYKLCISYKENVNPRSRSKVADDLTQELRNLMVICRENIQHTQKLQKQANNKRYKPKSYALSKKVWWNSKYIQTKYNRNLEARFFKPFRVLYLMNSQAYKLKQPK